MSVTAKGSAKQHPTEQSKYAYSKSELLSTTAVPQRGDDDSAGESAEQNNNKSFMPAPAPPPIVAMTAPPPTSPHHRQSDHGSSDDGAAPVLPVFVRFADLRAAGIVSNWAQLYNLIDEYGFPPGVMLSPNARAWNVDDVRAWLDARPTDRKKVV
jgi:hypothetical protein